VSIGNIDLDNGPVLGIILAAAADTDVDERREYDMAQNAALRGGRASGNVLLERFELFHRLPRLIQLDLDLLVLLVHCRVVLPLNDPNAPLLTLGDKRLASDLGLENFEILQPWYLEVFPGRVVERSHRRRA